MKDFILKLSHWYYTTMSFLMTGYTPLSSYAHGLNAWEQLCLRLTSFLRAFIGHARPRC